MRRIKKIYVVTGSRSDYGLLYWVMKEIKENKDMELIPLVTGAHLSKESGYTVREVLNDGFENLTKIKISDGDASPYGIAKSIGLGVIKFADFFNENKVDFLLLLGDRFEMLSAATAALPYNIPIGHIGGGEISEGVIDDSIRHCLTKLSHLHFPITGECANRISQMGEELWRIKVVGSPRLDFVNNFQYKSKGELKRKFNIKFEDKVTLVIYHPVTLEFKDTETQIDNLLKAIEVINTETVILYPNIDTYSDVIIAKIEKFARNDPRVRLFKNFGRNDYLSILNAVDIMVGNSSSGIIEGPSFGLPVVNIGNRQKGRDHIENVINVDYSCKNIVEAIKKGLYNENFISSLKNVNNPYGDGKASERIVDILSNIDLDKFDILKKDCFKEAL